MNCEKPSPRVMLAALVLALSVPGQAQQAADSTTNIALVLKPTDHPRVPRDLSQLWMAPEKGRARTAAQANLATAIKLEGEGSHAKALVLLTHPATAQQGPLAPYVEYYKGLAQLRSGTARRSARHVPGPAGSHADRLSGRGLAAEGSRVGRGPRRSRSGRGRLRTPRGDEDHGAGTGADEPRESGQSQRRRGKGPRGVRTRVLRLPLERSGGGCGRGTRHRTDRAGEPASSGASWRAPNACSRRSSTRRRGRRSIVSARR